MPALGATRTATIGRHPKPLYGAITVKLISIVSVSLFDQPDDYLLVPT
jgi:hypothetical protein